MDHVYLLSALIVILMIVALFLLYTADAIPVVHLDVCHHDIDRMPEVEPHCLLTVRREVQLVALVPQE